MSDNSKKPKEEPAPAKQKAVLEERPKEPIMSFMMFKPHLKGNRVALDVMQQLHSKKKLTLTQWKALQDDTFNKPIGGK